MSRRLLSIAMITGLLVLLGACRAEFTVVLDVTEDGSGTVMVTGVFDAEAASQIDGFAEVLRVDDLAAAGWTVADPVIAEDGSVELAMTKQVFARDQWQPVLDEIAGPDVFVNVNVASTNEFARRTHAVSFSVDLSRGWHLLTDPDIADLFGGQPFGVPLDELTDGVAIDDAVGVTVRASIAADDGDSATAAMWNPRFDDDRAAQVEVAATNENSFAVLLRWIGFALLSLVVLSTLLAALGIYLERRSERNRPEFDKPEPLSSRIPQIDERAASAPVLSPAEAGPVRLIVLNAMVLLYSRIPQHEAMRKFVDHNGGTDSVAELQAAWDDVITGRVDTAAFWDRCGLDVGDEDVDALFIAMRELAPGAAAFVDELRRRRIPLAAVTDDVETWSTLTRSRDGLLDVWPWICSAATGETLPSLGSLDRLRRETGVAYEHCLYVDNVVENLDAAASLGMRTVCLSDDRAMAQGRHAVVDSFAKLYSRRG